VNPGDGVARPLVVKVGGSLFDLPDLGPRLRRWLNGLRERAVLLVPGGGPTTDVVRDLDRRHALGEESAHWLALMALAVNAQFLAALLPHAAVVDQVSACPELWRQGLVPVLDVYRFALDDEREPGRLPHSWAVTSDSVAARVAVVAGARRLILLKSASIPDGTGWAEAARQGVVDPYFAEVVGRTLPVQTVNLRQEPA
jgi:aspartokinase-like uncharacterized kinase